MKTEQYIFNTKEVLEWNTRCVKARRISKTDIMEPFNLYTHIMINSKFPSLINNNNSFQSLYKSYNNEIKENQ
jgi:hypothetical protein